MKLKLFIAAANILCCNLICLSQNRNSVWVFGDSAGIDFSIPSFPVNFVSSLDTRGTCVSIADSSGTLLFYANTRASVINSGQVWNNSHQLLKNGDGIRGQGWYHEMVAIPDPGHDSLYYLFSICVTSSCPFGLYYSVININSDSVIQKNIQLQSFPMVDCLTAVKHGNGRDWWLLFRRWNPNGLPAIDEFHSYLINPAGITNYSVQHVGTGNTTNEGQITFNSNGGKFIFTNLLDLIEQYDFDRCTGIISNPVTIQPPGTPPPYYQITWSSAFSPNDNVLYVSTSGSDTNYLYQFDLTASNILASRITLDTFYLPPVSPGALKLAPDGKIYFSCAYDNGFNFNYPYADTMYNYVNMNLSVINYPDSLGSACGYAPFSFYLGGKRTYFGLPNNPDYELGALTGSICDSLTSVQEFSEQNLVNAFPNPVFNQIVVMSREKIKTITLTDVSGKICLVKEINSYPANGIVIDMEHFEKGIYLLKTKTEKGIEIKKLVKL